MIRFLWGLCKLGFLFVVLAGTAGLAFLLTLHFATSAETVEVPDLVGLDPPAAVRALNRVGLGIQFEEESQNAYDDEIPAGRILRQEPAGGGRLKKERRVRVVLSLGPRQLFVPRVVGDPVTAAQLRLQEAGLRVGDVVYVASRLVPANVVIDQEPRRWKSEEEGTVNLLVSSGGGTPAYVMPDLIGKPALRARGFLELRGFRVKVEAVSYEGAPPGRVARQKPLSGHPVTAGDTIWLWVTE